MRNITQIESLNVCGGLSHRELVGFLAFHLGLLGFNYYFIMPLSYNMGDLPVVLPITAVVNVSVPSTLG